MDSRVIFVIGAPGAGKGSLSKRLASNYGLNHVSVGDVLRDTVQTPDVDATVVDHVRDGTLVPTDALFSVLAPHLYPPNDDRFTFLDGFPRQLDQAKAFENKFGPPLLVVFMDCPEHLAKQRVLRRRAGRAGDNIETFNKRYREFSELNPPIVDYYRTQNKILQVDTSRSSNASYARLRSILSTKAEWRRACNRS